MENTEIKEKLEFTTQSLNHLNTTRKWTMFFSILGFIGVGIMIIVALLLITGGLLKSLPDLPDGASFSAAPLGIVGFLYIIIAVLYFFPIYFLLQFSINSKKAILYKDEYLLEKALRNLKNHYMFVGVLTIIVFSFYFIFILAFGVGTMMNY